MGAINNNASVIYLTITDGKICRRVQSPTNNSKERLTKDGRMIHEEQYAGWEGTIKNITTRESDYGKDWVIEIFDGETTALLQFKYSSGYASSFLKALPNVDLDMPVTISPKLQIDGDKKKAVIFLNQSGKAIKWYYTKDTPNGLPPLQQIKVKGVNTWDDSEMMEFLEDMVKTKLKDSETPF